MHKTIKLLTVLAEGAPDNVRAFIENVVDVLSLGERFIVRMGPIINRVSLDDILIGCDGMGIKGSVSFLPFDKHLKLTDVRPEHFDMPASRETCYGTYRPAVSFRATTDGMFGMIARDDEMQPGRALRDAISEAIDAMQRTAEAQGKQGDSICVTIDRTPHGLVGYDDFSFGEAGLRLPRLGIEAPWDHIRGCIIEDDLIVALDGRKLLQLSQR